MTSGPVLATTNDSKRTAKILGETVPMIARVHGYLHILGEQEPYFSLTYWAHRVGFPFHRQQGGAGHDTIRKLFGDRFDDLAALHLCKADGTPSYAAENGAYKLFGYFGGMGQRYHYGNSDYHFPLKPRDIDPEKPWRTTEYRKPTRLECLDAFARMWRITTDEARTIATDCRSRAGDNGERFKARLAEHAATMAARWKADADAAIEKHGLVIHKSHQRG